MSVTHQNATAGSILSRFGALNLSPAAIVLAMLSVSLCGLYVFDLAHLWNTDPSLSHGPIVLLVALGMCWMVRDRLGLAAKPDKKGLVFLIFSAVLFIAAAWIDIDFLKPLAMLMAAAGAFWYLGGSKALIASLSPLGMLVYTIPWPTAFTERCAFPVQLVSSAWAAQLAGAVGVPIYRQGVYLAVLPDGASRPIYEVIVAQRCSGLTSLVVLMALGYLFAYFTPVRWQWKLLMATMVIPLALILNAVRLAVILWFGAHYSPTLAEWVHDHEQPVLVFFSSCALLGLRHVLLEWTTPPGVTPTGHKRAECNEILS